MSPSTPSENASTQSTPLRISQRQPLSCNECTRRKTRCDKIIPCLNCRSRGLGESCHVEPVVQTRHIAVPSHIQVLREETVEAHTRLERRVAELERFLRRGDGAQTRDQSVGSEALPLVSVGDDRGNDEVEAATSLEFLTMDRVRRTSSNDQKGNELPFSIYRSSPPIQTRDLLGPDSSRMHEASSMWPGKAPEVVDGPSNLASYSLQRTVPGVITTNPMSYDLPKASYPLQGSPGSFNSFPTSSASLRVSILSKLPTIPVGRALVRYTTRNIVWMHCCYHVPTVEAEIEAFWSRRAAGSLEPDWSFVAFVFSILMSAVHHMPHASLIALFPHDSVRSVLESYFQCCMNSLHEASWLSTHSLYTVQTVILIGSPANHLDKTDLYFTVLGAAIRIAQALNLHRLGPDPNSKAAPLGGSAIVIREVKKRIWWQLTCQDWFHAAFNGTCSIHSSQFNTPPPLHCRDEELMNSKATCFFPPEFPTVTSDLIQMVQLATLINKIYSTAQPFHSLPYETILKLDEDMNNILQRSPEWMKTEGLPRDHGAPEWLEWQSRKYMVSLSHKVILLHRSYLGPSLRGEKAYAYSRQTCLHHARKILSLFRDCELETFRKTWTVLVHVVAASLVLLLEAAHQSSNDYDVLQELIRPVEDALVAFRLIAPFSSIAEKGLSILGQLIERYRSPERRSGMSKRKEFVGKAEVELNRAAKLFHHRNDRVAVSNIQAEELDTVPGYQTVAWENTYPVVSTTAAFDDGGQEAATWDQLGLLDLFEQFSSETDWSMSMYQ